MQFLCNEKNISIKKCAFCKNWYDPANSAIEPQKGPGMWKCDTTVKNKCRVKNVQTVAMHTCSKFECKL